jgi:hypothetical protein
MLSHLASFYELEELVVAYKVAVYTFFFSRPWLPGHCAENLREVVFFTKKLQQGGLTAATRSGDSQKGVHVISKRSGYSILLAITEYKQLWTLVNTTRRFAGSQS